MLKMTQKIQKSTLQQVSLKTHFQIYVYIFFQLFFYILESVSQDEDLDEEFSLSSESETSIKTTMNFTFKNMDHVREVEIIGSEKLTSYPEEFMSKNDQKNSIEKTMDSKDDDIKCELVNESVSSKMDKSRSSLHVEKIAVVPKGFKENDFETDSVNKWFSRKKEAESEEIEIFPVLTLIQDEVPEEKRDLESVAKDFKREQPPMLPPELSESFMENSDFVVYDDSIEKTVENERDKNGKISTSLKNTEIENDCRLPDVNITETKVSDNKKKPIFDTFENKKSGHLNENAIRKETNEIMEEYKTKSEPPSSTSYFSTYEDNNFVDLHSVLNKEDIFVEMPKHDDHSIEFLDSEVEMNLKSKINNDEDTKDDNQNKFEELKSELSSYQYDQSGDKLQEEHTFPIIYNQSSCETSNDEKVFEKQTPFFNELGNKDLGFPTEYDDLQLAPLPQKDLSKVVCEKINEQDDQLNNTETESEKGTQLLELPDIVFANSFPGGGGNSVNSTTTKTEMNVTPSSIVS